MSSDVTVIIPCYGQAEYLLDAVNSCRRQTVKPKEIIAILMDEESWKLANQLSDIHYVIKPRLDVPAARNLGFALARTKFVIPLDADDMLPDNYIEEVLKHKDEADTIYTGSIRFGTDNRITEPYDYICKSFLRRNYAPSIPCTCLFRREVWKEVGGYNEEFIYGHEDSELLFRLFTMGKTFAPCFEVKLLYRKHGTYCMSYEMRKYEDIILNHLGRLYPKMFSNHNGPIEERKNFTLQYENIYVK